MEEALESSEPKWADRLWVVQECILGAKIDLCCGRTRTPYGTGLRMEELCFAWYTYCGMTSEDWDALEEDTPLFGLQELLNQYRSHPPRSLLEAAQLTKTASVTDLKDRVYALLGIVPQEAIKGICIEPDHALETWQVYAQATFASMVADPSHADNCLNTLALGSIDSGIDLSLPGWAFDFRYVGAHSAPKLASVAWFRYNPQSDNDLYQYWSGYRASNESLVALSEDLRHLRVSGVIFASIIESYSASSETESESDVTSDLQEDPCTLFTLPSERRLLAVYSAARDQLNGEQSETPACFATGKRGVHPIAFWHGDRPLWEDPDLFAISTIEGEDTIPDAADMIRAMFEDWDFTVVLQSPRDGRWLSTAHRVFDTAEVFHAYYEYARLRPLEPTLDFFATSNGFLGLAATQLVEGDIVALVKGCKWPVALRRDGSHWAFKGICFVHGILEGELLQIWDDLGLEEEEFVLM